MSTSIQPLVSRYFAAANAHDANAVAACFAHDGVVTDEGAQHRGHLAIAQWQRTVSAQYQVRMTPASSVDQPGGCVVTAHVAGDFPGSPLDLHFAFTLNGEHIAALEITA